MKRRPLRTRVGFAVAGLREAYARERSFRTHTRFAAAAAGAVVGLGRAPPWWALVALTVALVLAFEMMNSALEGFIDLMHPGLHPEIKVAKDMAAGAVLLMSLAALAVGACLVWSAGPAALVRWEGWVR